LTCCNESDDSQPHYRCQKHQITMCDACLKCRDPDLYCKFRESCVIHFLEKEQQRKKKSSAG